MATKRQRRARGQTHSAAAIEAYRAGDERALARALKLPPWHISPLAVGDGYSPYPSDHGYGDGPHGTWLKAQKLRRDLEAAIQGDG